MGRPQRFTHQQILDSTIRLIASRGPGAASMAAVAAEVGGPTGSIYHRFDSREHLLAEVWLGIADSFQAAFVDLLRAPGPALEAGVEAALHTPRWARHHLPEARIFLLQRREDLLQNGWPEPTKARAERLRVELRDAMLDFTRRAFGDATGVLLERTALALVDIPYAAVRRHLAGGNPPPVGVDGLITEASGAMLAPAR